MRIAMALRADAETVFGGDTQVMRKLSEALRALGDEVVVAPLGQLPPAREFDLLHLFNLPPVAYARQALEWAHAADLPVVFSPLYYASYREWFELGITSTVRWSFVRRVLGQARAWAAFQRFQDFKLPFVSGWRGARLALQDATCIATSTQWENSYLATHFRLDSSTRERMQISPLGIDTAVYGRDMSSEEIAAFRERHQLKEGYLLEVARIEPKKNQLAVIEALYDEDIPLVFLGRPLPYEPEYARRCHELGRARGGVTFLQWLPEEDLPLIYAAAGAHILPSWMELPGLTSLEAASSGCRVISTAISSVTELLGSDAWYCDPFDRSSIRDTVVLALKASLAAPGPAALRTRLLAELNWQRAAVANRALYEAVLAGARR